MKNHNIECFIRIRLDSQGGNSKGSFGPGAAGLLSGVEKTGSLYQAAKDMQMSYSKAWTLLRNVEADLGWPLLERQGPKGSELTPKAKRLLNSYFQMQRQADNAVREIINSTIL